MRYKMKDQESIDCYTIEPNEILSTEWYQYASSLPNICSERHPDVNAIGRGITLVTRFAAKDSVVIDNMATTATMPEQQNTELPLKEGFFRYFQHEVTALQEQIARLDDHGASGGERADAVDHCLAGIARLSNEVKDASSYIPAYDQRTYSDAIKGLSNKLQDLRSKVAPRQKFSFKSASFTTRKNESAISLNDAAELASQKRRQLPGYTPGASNESSFATTPADLQSPAPETVEQGEQSTDVASAGKGPIRMPSFSQTTSVGINNHEDQHIILPPSASHATSSGNLSSLRRCVIDMSGPTASGQAFAGLTLKNISQSLIICGHVSGAAHLTKVTDSVVVVASRQFRMHESKGCDVYLHAAGRPIIEDCSGVRFAPLPETYTTDADRAVQNQWEAVDDFKWLKLDPSPNWSKLGESNRVSGQVWTEVVPGGPKHGTEEILKAVGIAV